MINTRSTGPLRWAPGMGIYLLGFDGHARGMLQLISKLFTTIFTSDCSPAWYHCIIYYYDTFIVCWRYQRKEEEEPQPSHGASNLILSATLTYISDVAQSPRNPDILVFLLPPKERSVSCACSSSFSSFPFWYHPLSILLPTIQLTLFKVAFPNIHHQFVG